MRALSTSALDSLDANRPPRQKMPLLKKLKITGIVIAILAVVIAVAWGGFLFKRWAHYGLYYKGQVQEQISPLESRVDALESRLRELEKKR